MTAVPFVRGRTPWLGIFLLVGCAGAPPAADPGAMPPTDSDPPAWVPTPGGRGQTGSTVALSTSGGYDQARAVAVRLVQAVRDADPAALERLLADPIGRVFPRLGPPNRSRAHIVQAMLRSPRRRGLTPQTPMERLVDTTQITVVPLAHSEREGTGSIPEGLRGSDLLVTFPLSEDGRRFFRHLLGWPVRGGVVVRPGPEARVVAL